MTFTSMEAHKTCFHWRTLTLLVPHVFDKSAKKLYLPIAISLQCLVRRISVIGLIGNEVRALHLVDGFNLGKSSQVFVIKDLIIHFSLRKGKTQDEDRENSKETGVGERSQLEYAEMKVSSEQTPRL